MSKYLLSLPRLDPLINAAFYFQKVKAHQILPDPAEVIMEVGKNEIYFLLSVSSALGKAFCNLLKYNAPFHFLDRQALQLAPFETGCNNLISIFVFPLGRKVIAAAPFLD
jgi:hypothetical protein